MNSINDDIGGESRIGQNLAENSGIAMTQWPHGVKCVSSVTGARRDTGASGTEVASEWPRLTQTPRFAASVMTSVPLAPVSRRAPVTLLIHSTPCGTGSSRSRNSRRGSDRSATLRHIIVDGIHLDPVIVQLFLKAKGPEAAVLITDATAATGMPDGRYVWAHSKLK